MTTPSTMLAKRVYQAYVRRAKRVVLRQVTTVPGPNPSPNPPTCEAPVLAASYPAGATVVSINAAAAIGRLIQGDTLTIGGAGYVVAGTVASRAYANPPPGFDHVQLEGPLGAAAAAGAPILATWAADFPSYAKIGAFPRYVLNDELVQAQDLDIRVPAWNLPPISNEWQVIIDGEDFAIVSHTPIYAGQVIVEYQVQAR